LAGSPAVWNTAMVFFQAALLAGYAYAHLAIDRLGVRRQSAWHLLILLGPLCVLPLALPAQWTPPTQSNPIPWLLGVMAVTVGVPFFALSTTAPVLQKWFAATRHRAAADPYFLYAVSNVGSMLALLGYPLVVEPHFSVAQQSRYWMWGYGLLVGLIGLCAAGLWRSQAGKPSSARPADPAPGTAEKLPLRRRLRWALLAFVPSSLMLSVTTFLSSDVAVVPLMWVIPLALYLLTFILVFARRTLLPQSGLARVFPMLVVALVLLFNLQATQPIAGLMLLHLATFFVGAMLCHAQLAADRPAPVHLTPFYLWMSVGGVLGGIFNALVAPLIFNSIVEYPLTLMLACVVGLRAARDDSSLARMKDWVWPGLFGLGTAGIILLGEKLHFATNAVVTGLLLGVPTLICYLFSRSPASLCPGGGRAAARGQLLSRRKRARVAG